MIVTAPGHRMIRDVMCPSRGQAMVRTLPVYDNGRGFQNTFCLVYQIKFSNLKIHVLNIAIVVYKS